MNKHVSSLLKLDMLVYCYMAEHNSQVLSVVTAQTFLSVFQPDWNSKSSFGLFSTPCSVRNPWMSWNLRKRIYTWSKQCILAPSIFIDTACLLVSCEAIYATNFFHFTLQRDILQRLHAFHFSASNRSTWPSRLMFLTTNRFLKIFDFCSCKENVSSIDRVPQWEKNNVALPPLYWFVSVF